MSVFDTGSAREVARIRVGIDPIQLLSDRNGRFLFISNLGSGEVVVVETASFQVVDRIEVADEPLDLALSSDGSRMYVTNSGAGAVSAIETSTREATRIPLASGVVPYGSLPSRMSSS